MLTAILAASFLPSLLALQCLPIIWLVQNKSEKQKDYRFPASRGQHVNTLASWIETQNFHLLQKSLKSDFSR